MKKGQLELKLDEVKESENDSGKWEHYSFIAYEKAKPARTHFYFRTARL